VCGRFALFTDSTTLGEYFELGAPADGALLAPSYNVTPGRDIAAVRVARDGTRRLGALRWGLVPFWANDASIGHRLVNARLETLAEKAAFREAFARRRCLIPASGFYEWAQASRGGTRARRQPYFIRPRAEPLFAIAGLWERWRGNSAAPLERPLESCVIVTTPANDNLASIHDRMPLLIARADFARWLEPSTSAAAAAALAIDACAVEAWHVGPAINDPRNDDSTLIERSPPPAPA
jgi:putative SOS response-associated peptidase YedK